MEARDIMKGDIVMVSSLRNDVAEVNEIYKKLTPPFKWMVRVERNCLTYCVPLSEIEPIPLTIEILEKNGFRESIEEGTYYFPERYQELNVRGFAIETEGDGRWMITDHPLLVFRYVHVFQRVLRCCGLNDLADNFKV